MDELHTVGLVTACGMVGFGLLLIVFARPFAAFQREKVSHLLPGRYWVLGSNPVTVRVFGIGAAGIGVVLAVVTFVSTLV
jgi:hypothetical protein